MSITLRTVDLQTPIRYLDGTIAIKKKGEDTYNLTVREAIKDALVAVFQHEEEAAAKDEASLKKLIEEKRKRYNLATKVYGSDEASLTSDEQAYIKERVTLYYNSPEVSGFLETIIEGEVPKVQSTPIVKSIAPDASKNGVGDKKEVTTKNKGRR